MAATTSTYKDPSKTFVWWIEGDRLAIATTAGDGSTSETDKGRLKAIQLSVSSSLQTDGSTKNLVAESVDATQTTMVTNRTNDKIRVPLNSTIMFRLDIVARRTGVQTESAAYEILGCIKNDAGTTALEGTITKTVIAEGDAAWDVTAVANNTDDTLEIKVTGQAGNNINWVASGRLTETNGA